jgi:hypothetical protein
MRPWRRFIFIFFAYGIAILHTAVPHQHDEATDNRVVITHAGCLFTHSMDGFLQMLFSTDLGDGHLETFKKGGDTELTFSPVSMSVIALFWSAPRPAIIRIAPKFVSVFVDQLKKRLLLFSARHFRAPPLFA